ncbi:uncharacterized protein BDW43DRAFT_262616 [Aspergillus alliaceus]|uniref:uncharacterized protein n=1 Tax=Petromyces alliaceus TaxID=209559 RepID=UPI0012A49701|nr:uncharacterized protein BDW43DRAFT_262616 [Aspergillus alliaceus]KAB8237920.1 hypothetical protein BDW43DRAFT_262616 [Aspergillus alliaceus]
MDAILCAVNIFGQDDTYRLPEGQKGAVYNAYCRKNSGEITYWSVDYSIGKCLVKFADGISKTKRDSGSWVGWKVESKLAPSFWARRFSVTNGLTGVQMVDDDARFEKTI